MWVLLIHKASQFTLIMETNLSSFHKKKSLFMLHNIQNTYKYDGVLISP